MDVLTARLAMMAIIPAMRCCRNHCPISWMSFKMIRPKSSAHLNSLASTNMPSKNTGMPPGPGSQPIAPDVSTSVKPTNSVSGRRIEVGKERQ